MEAALNEELSVFQAAHVIGCSPSDVNKLVDQPLIIENVEAAALFHYPWKAHVHDPDSYWVTTAQAAQILAVNNARVKQLITAGRIPYETHRSGTYLMRRHQLEVVANARQAKKLRQP